MWGWRSGRTIAVGIAIAAFGLFCVLPLAYMVAVFLREPGREASPYRDLLLDSRQRGLLFNTAILGAGTALTATLVFYLATRLIGVLRSAPLWIVGPLYGVVVFCAMNYGTLPALSWLRSLYLHTPPRWPGSMSWPQLFIHMVCVGPPIVWGVRRAR